MHLSVVFGVKHVEIVAVIDRLGVALHAPFAARRLAAVVDILLVRLVLRGCARAGPLGLAHGRGTHEAEPVPAHGARVPNGGTAVVSSTPHKVPREQHREGTQGAAGGQPYLLSFVSTTAFRSHSWWSRNSLLSCASFSSALSRMPRKIFSNCFRCLTVAAIAAGAAAGLLLRCGGPGRAGRGAHGLLLYAVAVRVRCCWR